MFVFYSIILNYTILLYFIIISSSIVIMIVCNRIKISAYNKKPRRALSSDWFPERKHASRDARVSSLTENQLILQSIFTTLSRSTLHVIFLCGFKSLGFSKIFLKSICHRDVFSSPRDKLFQSVEFKILLQQSWRSAMPTSRSRWNAFKCIIYNSRTL